MGWNLALAATATYAKPEQFETFRRHLDPGWIEHALAATGTATVRRRRLPVEEVDSPNRRMRTRLSGGVAGVPGNLPGPLCR